VHVKTLVAQEQRMLLTRRKLLQRKLVDVESDCAAVCCSSAWAGVGKPPKNERAGAR